MDKEKSGKGCNWSGCSKFDECEDDRKHIMTYCDMCSACLIPQAEPSLKGIAFSQTCDIHDNCVAYRLHGETKQ